MGDPGSISGLGRSPREGNGNPFQYSCLENSVGFRIVFLVCVLICLIVANVWFSGKESAVNEGDLGLIPG